MTSHSFRRVPALATILAALCLGSAQARLLPQSQAQPSVFIAQVTSPSATSAVPDSSTTNTPADSATPQTKEDGPTPEQNSLQRKLLSGLMVVLAALAAVYLRRKRSASPREGA
jgi:hypothetical protein